MRMSRKRKLGNNSLIVTRTRTVDSGFFIGQSELALMISTYTTLRSRFTLSASLKLKVCVMILIEAKIDVTVGCPFVEVAALECSEWRVQTPTCQ